MSSPRQEELASLLRALRDNTAFNPHPHTLTTPFTNSVLRLLSIIHNSLISVANRPLTVLEQVVTISASLTGFPKPVQQLAALDRGAFVQACGREYSLLPGMSYGLFPRVNAVNQLPALMSQEKASGLEWVGNPKWAIKREVLRAWVKAGVRREEKMSALILLGDAALNQISLQKGWQSIWAAIYLWYYDKAMKSLPGISGNPTWFTDTDQKHFEAILKATDSLVTSEEKLTSSLLVFILREFVLGQKYSKDFRDAYELLPEMKWLPWELLLINECFHTTAEKMQFQNVAERSRSLARKIKKELNEQNKGTKNDLSLQMKNFLPQLFSEEELDAYVEQQKLAFWEFGFDETTCARLALQQLPHLEQANSAALLLNLSPNDLLTAILRRNQRPHFSKPRVFSNNAQMEMLFRTVGDNAHKLSLKIASVDEAQHVEKILKKFSKDWQTIYLLQESPYYQVSPQSQLKYTLKDVLALFDNDESHTAFCELPSDDVELLWSELISLLAYVNQKYQELNSAPASPKRINKAANPLKKGFSMRELKNMLVSEVMERLLRDVDADQLEVYWNLVGQILLQDEEFMDQMLNIPVEQNRVNPPPIAKPAAGFGLK